MPIPGPLPPDLTLTIRSMDRAFFAGRLPLIRVRWHLGGPLAGCAYSANSIGLNLDLLTQPRSQLYRTLAHELAHCWCWNEQADHGPRWRRTMARIGIDPQDGRATFDGPFDRWLKTLAP